jgi:hypothetical protein
MKRITLGLLVPAISLLFAACTVTTGPTAEVSCEQRFDVALERGVPYTEALGSYTQCLIDRGDTINTNIRNR